MKTPLFPTIKQTLTDFIEDEEGAIPAANLLTIGAMVVVLSTILESEALAKHRSHSSHSSHSSSSYVRGHGSHTSAAYTRSHGSHASHASSVYTPSHSSHTSSTYTPSHSSHASHTSSVYTPPSPSNETGSFGGDSTLNFRRGDSNVAPPDEPKMTEQAKEALRKRINSLTWETPQSAPEGVEIPSVEEILKLETPEATSFNEVLPTLATPLDTPKHNVVLPSLQEPPETPDLLNRN